MPNWPLPLLSIITYLARIASQYNDTQNLLTLIWMNSLVPVTNSLMDFVSIFHCVRLMLTTYSFNTTNIRMPQQFCES